MSQPDMSLWDYYRRYCKQRDLARSTEQHLEATLRKFEEWMGRAAILGDFSDDLMNQFVIHLRDQEYTPRTCKGRRNDLLALWRSAFEEELIDVFPRRVRRVKLPDLPNTTWTPTQYAALHATARQETIYFPNGVHSGQFWDAFLRGLKDTGLRISDLCSLKQSKTGLRRDQISPEGVVTVTQQKTGKIHTCRMHLETVQAVLALPDVNGRAYPFPYKRESFYTHWHRILKGAGLPTGRREGPQKVRRTGATEVAQEHGVEAASRFLGHSPRSGTGLAVEHYLGPDAYMAPPLPPGVQEPKSSEADRPDLDQAAG